ncbi:AzlC family ABC transporter permease [Asanoa sp. WMMD1127]|uniref:AzlC family ABC transporter permease n=1 Tax=Asanoa sp. WMMD1127 TaxID=3016107 RepID=UPI002417A514|nr:AzlC family ABC transporter permease [Asanoa sp. WMMD1127]MDG4827193.1 AzlC family ABC transporter permease [Asanoa sp. WMMD1127]
MTVAARSILGDRTLLRDVGALGLAAFAVGLSFGAIAVAAGIPAGLTVLMSLIVFAGGAQFLAVGLIAAGNPFAAVFAGLLLNARHLPFGLAIGDAIGGRWWQRLVGAHLLVDESVAFALAQTDPARRRRAYWATGCTLFVLWNLGGVLGVLLGNVGDPDALGLDAAFPAGLFALLLPTLRDPTTRLVALTGALVAVVTTPFLPAGLPVLLALSGLLLVLVRRRPEAAA